MMKNGKAEIKKKLQFRFTEKGFVIDFLATYATLDKTGKVRHMPLQYALTEYETQREKRCQYAIAACEKKIQSLELLMKGDFPEELKELFLGARGLFRGIDVEHFVDVTLASHVDQMLKTWMRRAIG